MTRLNVVDTTMRDGANSFSHQFTTDQVSAIAAGLDQAGVKLIEVTHGDGLGGSSLQLGRAAHSDPEYIIAAVKAVKDARIAVLYVPGIATLNDLAVAQQCGATAVRDRGALHRGRLRRTGGPMGARARSPGPVLLDDEPHGRARRAGRAGRAAGQLRRAGRLHGGLRRRADPVGRGGTRPGDACPRVVRGGLSCPQQPGARGREHASGHRRGRDLCRRLAARLGRQRRQRRHRGPRRGPGTRRPRDRDQPLRPDRRRRGHRRTRSCRAHRSSTPPH